MLKYASSESSRSDDCTNRYHASTTGRDTIVSTQGKDDAVKVLTQYCQQIWKTAVAKGLEEVSFHSNPKEGQCQKCSNYHIIVLVSHASKVMHKILQARLQQYVNQELPDVQAGFRKDRHLIAKKSSTLALLTTLKPSTVWITKNCVTTDCGKFLKRWEYQTTSPVF